MVIRIEGGNYEVVLWLGSCFITMIPYKGHAVVVKQSCSMMDDHVSYRSGCWRIPVVAQQD